MKTQMPSILHHAVILEECSAPYTLSVHPTIAAAIAKLEAERRKFDPNCKEECWLYVETVRNGTVIGRRDLSLENPSQETHEC